MYANAFKVFAVFSCCYSSLHALIKISSTEIHSYIIQIPPKDATVGSYDT